MRSILLLILMASPVQAQTHLFNIGSRGSGPGQFYQPWAIAESSGRIYVSDWINKNVSVFDLDGAYLYGFSPDVQLIAGLAVGADLFTTEIYNARVQKFSTSGTHLLTWGTAGSGPGEFSGPYDVAVGAGGTVYVADSGNGRVQVFTAYGVYIREWGSGELVTPRGIAIDGDGYVYVSDVGTDTVKKFSHDGVLFRTFGGPGSGQGQLDNPLGVDVDDFGNVFVVDNGNHRIEAFRAGGGYLMQWGSSGSGDGQFLQPSQVAVSGNRIYVVDSGNTRVQVFGYEQLPVRRSTWGELKVWGATDWKR